MCPRCGGRNPHGYTVCQFCSTPLLLPPPVEELPARIEEESSELEAPEEAPPWVPRYALVLWAGIGCVTLGVFLLGGAYVLHQQVVSYNSGCSATLSCSPESDTSGAFQVAGVVSLVVGIALAVYAARRLVRRDPPSGSG